MTKQLQSMADYISDQWGINPCEEELDEIRKRTPEGRFVAWLEEQAAKGKAITIMPCNGVTGTRVMVLGTLDRIAGRTVAECAGKIAGEG